MKLDVQSLSVMRPSLLIAVNLSALLDLMVLAKRRC